MTDENTETTAPLTFRSPLGSHQYGREQPVAKGFDASQYAPYVVAHRLEEFVWLDGPDDDQPLRLSVRKPSSLVAGELMPLQDWLRAGTEELAAAEAEQEPGDDTPAPRRTNETLFPIMAPWVTGWNLAGVVDGEVVRLPAPAESGPEAMASLPPGAVQALLWHFLGIKPSAVELARRQAAIAGQRARGETPDIATEPVDALVAEKPANDDGGAA